MKPLFCQGCGVSLTAGGQAYLLRLELLASPDPPEFKAESLEADLQGEGEALIQKMESMSDEEAREAEEQVYERYEFALCARCRTLWHRRFKKLAGLLRGPAEPGAN